MKTENSKTNEPNKFIYQFHDKGNIKNPNSKDIGSVNLSIYYTWKNIKSAYNNKLYWNDEFDTFDGSYSISKIQDYLEFIIKKHKTLAENPAI